MVPSICNYLIHFTLMCPFISTFLVHLSQCSPFLHISSDLYVACFPLVPYASPWFKDAGVFGKCWIFVFRVWDRLAARSSCDVFQEAVVLNIIALIVLPLAAFSEFGPKTFLSPRDTMGFVRNKDIGIARNPSKKTSHPLPT